MNTLDYTPPRLSSLSNGTSSQRKFSVAITTAIASLLAQQAFAVTNDQNIFTNPSGEKENLIGKLKLESGNATGLSVNTGNENISLKVTGETNLTVSSGNGPSYGISISSNNSSKASADVTLQKTIIKSDAAAKHHIASGIWVYGGYNPLPGGDHEAGTPSKLTVSGDLDLSVSGAYVITGITSGSMYKNNSYKNGIVELRGASNVIRIVGDNTDVEVGEPQGEYSRAVGVLAYENGKVTAEGKTEIDVSSNYRLVGTSLNFLTSMDTFQIQTNNHLIRCSSKF